MSFVGGFSPPLLKESKQKRKVDRPIGFSEPLSKDRPEKVERQRSIGFSAPLEKEDKPIKPTLPKRKVNYADMGRIVQEAIDTNLAEMKAVIKEFQDEFPMIKGTRGITLLGHECKETDENGNPCDKCPHRLEWTRYDYRKKDNFGNYEKPDYTYTKRGVSAHFKQSRSPHVVERFLYYDERRKVLNAQRKKLKISMPQMRGAYYRIERSKVFQKDE